MPVAAENQHYVPKFILRQFLSNDKNEQVTVFQKSTKKIFSTSIRNIMGERRFNEFVIDENFYASFEQSICRVEDVVLPAYKRLTEEKRLNGTPDEVAMLGLFVAFQMLRVRAYRENIASVIDQLRTQLEEKLKIDLSDVKGFEDMSENHFKRMHLDSLQDSIEKFSNVVAAKDFTLLQAPEGRSFYLGDNPVVLHNDQPKSKFWGNLGLSVEGIQIYVPLSSDLMLAAWCPSILCNFRKNHEVQRKNRSHILAGLTLGAGSLSADKIAVVKAELSKFDFEYGTIDNFLADTDNGVPHLCTSDNMDHYNSLQVMYASDFVVCPRGDFNLAKRVVGEEGAESCARFRVG